MQNFSPRYLISQNKAVEARSSLQWLRGADYDISMELSDMEQMALIQKKSKLKLKDLFGVANVRPFIISAGLMLFQQVLQLYIIYLKPSFSLKSESPVSFL